MEGHALTARAPGRISPEAAAQTDDVDTLAPKLSSSSSRGEPNKVVLRSDGTILSDFLMSMIIHFPSFGAV